MCEQLLARTPKLTTGQLIEQVTNWPSRSILTGRSAAMNRLLRNGKWSGTAMVMGRRICPGTTCRWTGSRRPAGESTLWPKLPNAPTTAAFWTRFAQTCFSG